MRRRNRVLAGVLAACALLAAAHAADPLAAFADAPLAPAVRAELARRAALWNAWTPPQRAAFRARARTWDALPPAERGARREREAAWRALAPAERARIRAALAAFAALPPLEQQTLRDRFAALDAREQRGWLLGPELGADYPALQPLLAQVPAPQRAPLLRVLRGLSREERRLLGVLAQRTPPSRRDALRARLIALPPPRRAAWLAQEVAR